MTDFAACTPTAQNAAILFLDLQTAIVKRNETCKVLEKRAVALAKLAALHTLPTVASSIPTGGAYLPGLLKALPGLEPLSRTCTTAFGDAATVRAIEATGRRTLILAGVASEIVVQRTALDALAAGYTVFVAIDACGGASERTEQAAWSRVVQAGGILTSTTTVTAEFVDDFGSELGGKTVDIMYETLG